MRNGFECDRLSGRPRVGGEGGGEGQPIGLRCHTSSGPVTATGQRTLSLVALLGDSQSKQVDEDMAADGQRAADEREKRTSVGTELKSSATGGQLFEMTRTCCCSFSLTAESCEN